MAENIQITPPDPKPKLDCPICSVFFKWKGTLAKCPICGATFMLGRKSLDMLAAKSETLRNEATQSDS